MFIFLLHTIRIPGFYFTLLGLMLSALYAFGQEQTVPVKKEPVVSRFEKAWADGPKVYYFPIDETYLSKEYRNNETMLRALDALLSDEEVHCCIDSVVIIAAASPIASKSLNERLSIARARVLRDYIREKHPVINPEKIYDYPAGIDWEGFLVYRRTEQRLTKPAQGAGYQNSGRRRGTAEVAANNRRKGNL